MARLTRASLRVLGRHRCGLHPKNPVWNSMLRKFAPRRDVSRCAL